jgi:hypothetical protein
MEGIEMSEWNINSKLDAVLAFMLVKTGEKS